MKKYYTAFAALFFSLCLFAQKERVVSGEYTYYAQEGQTLGQVKTLALQLAQVEAIASEFGSNVTDIVSQFLNNNGTHIAQFSDVDVKGVWIKDLEVPKYETIPEQDGFSLKCKVKGLAREVTSSNVEYTSRVLCNGFGKNHERTDFKDGDNLFLSFSSPVDGYLAVYLQDANPTVFCALPYYEQTDGIFKVDANKEYRLFSEEEAKGTKYERYVDQYQMTAENELDVNMLYVVFSPNKFYKADDHSGKGNQLRSLSFEEFNKWLGKRYSKDKELTVTKYVITIRK